MATKDKKSVLDKKTLVRVHLTAKIELAIEEYMDDNNIAIKGIAIEELLMDSVKFRDILVKTEKLYRY